MASYLSENVKKLINRNHFGFTKWGGAKRQFLQDDQDDWTCQACATRYAIEVPSFMTEIFDEEFAKICSKCQNVKVTEHIIEFDILIQKVRFVLNT